MRLLEFACDDELYLVTFTDEAIPPYAIFSHTWGTEEVSFQDVMEGTGRTKSGYGKIRFCGEQARRDGLKYFWVDTCCIEQSNSEERSEAMKSMFLWYCNASKCYVYLADVSRRDEEPWELKFLKSRWLARGWTLQELLGPNSIDFFSRDQERLGTKACLEDYVSKMTGIPVVSFRGCPPSNVSTGKRISCGEQHENSLESDQPCSLLGIFDVRMPKDTEKKEEGVETSPRGD